MIKEILQRVGIINKKPVEHVFIGVDKYPWPDQVGILNKNIDYIHYSLHSDRMSDEIRKHNHTTLIRYWVNLGRNPKRVGGEKRVRNELITNGKLHDVILTILP